MVKAKQWLLAKKPDELPKLDGPDATFKLTETDLPELKDDEVLIKLQYFSNDPAQRGWISKDIKPERLYVPPVQEGEIMQARGVGEVVESKSSSYQKGQTVIASTGWVEYAVVPAKEVQPAPDLPGGRSKTHYVGALGFTGFTAYCGLLEVVNTTKDDIVVISGAAGATGMMAVQIAKHVIGCKKVIGMAGTDEKCRWVESLGADVCLNYKKDSFVQDVEKATPGPDSYANVYFDNVGGEILDLMLTRLGRGGRVAACGAIAGYNSADAAWVKNWFEIIIMRLQIRGFVVLDYINKFEEFRKTMLNGVEEGKIKIDDAAETVLSGSFEEVPKFWMELFSGRNQGKLVTSLK